MADEKQTKNRKVVTKFKRNILYLRGDCYFYNIELNREYSVKDFIVDVLNTYQKENGKFKIFTEYGEVKIGYNKQLLECPIPEKIKDNIVEKVSANGASDINYSIYLKNTRRIIDGDTDDSEKQIIIPYSEYNDMINRIRGVNNETQKTLSEMEKQLLMYKKQTHAAIEKNKQLTQENTLLKQKLNKRKWWQIWK